MNPRVEWCEGCGEAIMPWEGLSHDLDDNAHHEPDCPTIDLDPFGE